jgi:hypothetical protein
VLGAAPVSLGTPALLWNSEIRHMLLIRAGATLSLVSRSSTTHTVLARAGAPAAVSAGAGAAAAGGALDATDRVRAGERLAAVASACTRATLATSKSSTTETLYDCRGRAAELASPAARESSS